MAYPFDFITDFIFADERITAADVILVPGSSQPQLMERAVTLLKQGMAKYILPSGGKNSKLPSYPSEADFLKAAALNMGVSPEYILCEDKASNTYENALFSYQLLERLNMKVDKAMIVCKAYHSRRALFSYQRAFPASIEFYVSPVTDNTGITKENWFTNTKHISTVMGEVEKIGRYFEDAILPMYER